MCLYLNVSQCSVSVGGKCIPRGNVPETSVVHSPNCEIHFEIILIRVANYADATAARRASLAFTALLLFTTRKWVVLNFNISDVLTVSLQRVRKMRQEHEMSFQTVKIVILCHFKTCMFQSNEVGLYKG